MLSEPSDNALSMCFFIGVTDYQWFRLHAEKSVVEEVNFWRPSPDAIFKALQPDEPFPFQTSRAPELTTSPAAHYSLNS